MNKRNSRLTPERGGGAEKIRTKARVTRRITSVAQQFTGESLSKAKQISLFVCKTIPLSKEKKAFEKMRVFKRSADSAVRRNHDISSLPCIERSNLAIALLNASGLNAWLARCLWVGAENKLKIHDTVEFVVDGNIYSLNFFSGPRITKGTANNSFKLDNPLVFLRGVDTAHIGGAKNWPKFKSFAERYVRDEIKELTNRDLKRLEMMLSDHIIPPNVWKEILEATVLNLKQARQKSTISKKI